MDRDTVHAVILQTAEEIANHKLRRVLPTMPVSGQVFRADSIMSQSGGLTLSIAENVDQAITQEQRELLWNLGADSIEEAIMENQEMWVGLILTEAREGRNYFEPFVNPDQAQLF